MPDSLNDTHTPDTPDPDAAVLPPRGEVPAQGRDVSDRDAKGSLPPGSDTKPGEPSDNARAQPYDEQPGGLRMHDEDDDPPPPSAAR